MQFGQKLVFDCSYDDHMTDREAINAAKQLMLSFAENRINDDPFDVHFCNANFGATTMQYLHKHIPTLRDLDFPMHVHECSYMDLFPKEQLVYLTPHCRTDLVEYDPNDVYIVGAMVDKMNSEPLSLGKAKSLGLRMARLPLDRYLQFGAGSGKSLTLNQMTGIMLSIKNTRSWPEALAHVPRRKVSSDQIDYRDRLAKKWTRNVEKFKFEFKTNAEERSTVTTVVGDVTSGSSSSNIFSKSKYRALDGNEKFSPKNKTMAS